MFRQIWGGCGDGSGLGLVRSTEGFDGVLIQGLLLCLTIISWSLYIGYRQEIGAGLEGAIIAYFLQRLWRGVFRLASMVEGESAIEGHLSHWRLWLGCGLRC